MCGKIGRAKRQKRGVCGNMTKRGREGECVGVG